MNLVQASTTSRHVPGCSPSTSGRLLLDAAYLVTAKRQRAFTTHMAWQARDSPKLLLRYTTPQASRRRDDDYYEVVPEIVDDEEEPKAWPAILPALGAIAVASLFGPVLLSFVAAIAGLGVAFAAGTLALSFIAPVALSLGALFFVGSILQASFAAALLAGPLLFAFAAYQIFTKGRLGFFPGKSIKKQQRRAASDARAAEQRAREAAWESDQRQAEAMEKEELRRFDEMLKRRERQREDFGGF